MKAPLRIYRGPDPPYRFMETINSLSFHCGNMLQGNPGGIATLHRDLPFGAVIVSRVGSLAGVEHAVEIVVTKLIEEMQKVILSSARNETYGIDFNISKEVCKLGNRIEKISLPAEFVDETFIDPDYDSFVEVCPYVFTLNHKTFFVVVGQDNVFQTPPTRRDDWHNNLYTMDPVLSIGQHFLTYYETQMRNVSEVHVAFSFSPLTFSQGLAHIDRHINHALRLFIPILGRSAAFGEKYPKLKDCIDFPFGKKPFTRTADGITTYQEVVRPSGSVQFPDVLYFNSRLFWPFIPYLREIASFNLHAINGFPRKESLQDFGACYAYSIYYRLNGVLVSAEKRNDTLSYSAPPASYASNFDTTINLPEGIVEGSSQWGETLSQQQSYRVAKSVSLGTIGALNDLFVETDITGQLIQDLVVDGTLARDSNFPATYYSPEFIDDILWPCENYHDQTNATESLNNAWSNNISGTQYLKAGDIVIDSGTISMNYTGLEQNNIEHNGTANRDCTETVCQGCVSSAIAYTSLFMHVGEQQDLYVENPAADCSYMWQITAGGGGLSAGEGTSVVYTAPAGNPNCNSNPTITLSTTTLSGTVECDAVTFIINEYVGEGIAYQTGTSGQTFCSTGAPCDDGLCIIENCTFTRRSYKCDGSLTNTASADSQASFCVPPGTCENTATYPDCKNVQHTFTAWSQGFIADCRDDAMKAAGCCPGALG